MTVPNRARKNLWIGIVLALSGAGLVGCAHITAGTRVTAVEVPLKKPDALPYKEGVLTLAGAQVPVEVTRSERGDKIEFVLRSHGEVIDTERYRFDRSSFYLQSMASETYRPEIPLLRYPVSTISMDDWSGKVVADGKTFPASAKISATSEPLNVAGGPYDSVRVAVELAIDTGGARRVSRSLQFWFVDGKGIVRREAGSYSTREPR
ncbi:MAG: hypothetical protein JNM85_01790 [Chthonomonas sp.]|nr:hypothetical protein [Chthonomonas sp.]